MNEELPDRIQESYREGIKFAESQFGELGYADLIALWQYFRDHEREWELKANNARDYEDRIHKLAAAAFERGAKETVDVFITVRMAKPAKTDDELTNDEINIIKACENLLEEDRDFGGVVNMCKAIDDLRDSVGKGATYAFMNRMAKRKEGSEKATSPNSLEGIIKMIRRRD